MHRPTGYIWGYLTAWSLQFASKTEQLLWKIACFGIMGTFPTIMVTAIVLQRLHDHVRPDSKIVRRMVFCRYSPYITFFILSRLYIVVEAFISLRHVPIGAYAAIPWVQAIPHV